MKGVVKGRVGEGAWTDRVKKKSAFVNAVSTVTLAWKRSGLTCIGLILFVSLDVCQRQFQATGTPTENWLIADGLDVHFSSVLEPLDK